MDKYRTNWTAGEFDVAQCTVSTPRWRRRSRLPRRHSCVCPKGADYQWGKDPLEQLMVGFDSYRAVSLGNRASRNLVKKSTLGGRATLQAVTRVKLEQASKATMWTPTRRMSGEGRVDWEEPGAGARYRTTVSTSRATGVGSTACKEGSLRQWGRPGVVAGVASCERRRKGRRTIWASERVMVPAKPGNSGGGKGPYFWCACKGGR